MTRTSKRGFYVVSTLDRLDDLRRMLTSLRRYNIAPVQVMIARNWADAHRLKCSMGLYTTFETTIYLDTDMYIAGKLCALFAYADEGKLVIYREPDDVTWNSGVMAFNKELGMKLSSEWLPLFETNLMGKAENIRHESYNCCDQFFLNKIIGKYPIHSLSAAYNYISYYHSLEDEKMDWKVVRIFHFLHRITKHREQSRAYKEWMEL